MRKRLLSVLILILLLATACQPATSTSTEGTTASTGSSENSSGVESAEMPDGVESIAFYQPADASENDPQMYLFIEPTEEANTPTVMVECMGKQSILSAPSYGVELNNHCILETGAFRAHLVLPDGSFLSFEKDTIAQVNLSGGNVEVILQQGEVYNRVTPRVEGEKFVVYAGDTSFEALGTVYGVSLKDRLINTVVNNGIVYTHRCALWKDYTCMKWNQLSSEQVPFNQYTRSVGSEDWKVYNYEGTENFVIYDDEMTKWVPNPQINLTLPADKNQWDYLYTKDMIGVDFFSESLNNAFMEITESLIQDMMVLDEATFSTQANEINAGSGYCLDFPDRCFNTVTKPTLYTDYWANPEPVEPVSTGNDTGSTGSGGTSSSGSACAKVPAEIKPITSCQCGNTGVYGVFCDHALGQGWIPYACTVELGLCH